MPQIIDCPHCYTRVIAKADGKCPACQADTNDTRACDPTKTTVTIVEGIEPPCICYNCGQPTTRYVETHRSMRSDSDETILKAILSLFFHWMITSAVNGGRVSLMVELPQCKFCAADGPPKPTYVDFNNHRMTFVVDKRFKKEFASQK